MLAGKEDGNLAVLICGCHSSGITCYCVGLMDFLHVGPWDIPKHDKLWASRSLGWTFQPGKDANMTVNWSSKDNMKGILIHPLSMFAIKEIKAQDFVQRGIFMLMNWLSAQESWCTEQLHFQDHQSQTRGLIQRFSCLQGNFSTDIFRLRSLPTTRAKLHWSPRLGISSCCETLCTVPGVVLPHVTHHSPRQYLVTF